MQTANRLVRAPAAMEMHPLDEAAVRITLTSARARDRGHRLHQLNSIGSQRGPALPSKRAEIRLVQ